MDWLLVSVAALLLITAGAFGLYYRRLRKLMEEYDKAKTLVGDIVISFNKQVEKQDETIAAAIQKSVVSASRSSRAEGRLEAHENQIAQLSTKVSELANSNQETPNQLEKITQKITDITKTQEDLAEKITDLEGRAMRIGTPEINLEGAIPIKKDKALAALTPTELAVLEILANEGDKTAPEIKARVNLTREHTARLMKKLYEEGYLERTTGKIPFAYRIKEEMRKILKKPEAKA